MLSRKKKALFSLSMLLLCVGGAELGLRLAGYPRGIVRSFSRLWNPAAASSLGLFRPGSHRIAYPPELAYEVAVNALGLRGEDVTLEKPPETLRVLALGDSVTFGYYVDDADTYSALLQSKLRAEGRKVEVLNAGCGHFSIPDELAYFEERLLRLQPDVVLLQYCSNDLTPAELDREPTLYARVSSGRASKSNVFRQTALGEVQLLIAIKAKQWAKERRGEWPPKGFAQAGGAPLPAAQWSRYEALLAQLKALCDARGIPLLLLGFADLGEVEQGAPFPSATRLAALSAKLGIPFRGAWERYAASPKPRELYHWPLDPHPSAKGNALLAELAAELLQSAGVLR